MISIHAVRSLNCAALCAMRASRVASTYTQFLNGQQSAPIIRKNIECTNRTGGARRHCRDRSAPDFLHFIPHESIQLQAAARSKCPACQPLLACEKTKVARSKRRRRHSSAVALSTTARLGPCLVKDEKNLQKLFAPLTINLEY